jgi:hypothetical protein
MVAVAVDPRIREAVDRLTDAQVFELLRVAGIAWPAAPPTALGLMQAVGLEPDPWQRTVLTTEASRIILLCSRQSGKSQIAGALAVAQALAKPRSLILMGSGRQEQAGETLMKAKDLTVSDLFGMRITKDSDFRLALENASRFIVVPTHGSGGRSYSAVDLLIIDEAAYVEDEFYQLIHPVMTVSHGRQLLCSTAGTKSGVFYDIWENAPEWNALLSADEQRTAWLKIKVPWEMCPRIPPESVDEYRQLFGEVAAAREYSCEFTDVDASTFRLEDIQAAAQVGLRTLGDLW